MFQQANMPVVLRRLVLDIEENDEGDRVRLCKTTFRVSLLTREVAASVSGVSIVSHCFDRTGLPAWDVDDVVFATPSGKFTVTLKTAPDLDTPSAVLLLATVEKIRVWRPKKDQRDLSLEFVTVHELPRGDAKDLAEVLTMWEVGRLYCTFSEVQLSLLASGGIQGEAVDDEQPRTH